MSDQRLDRLVATGALLRGHFRLSSGNHSDTYVQCMRLFERPQVAASMVAELVAPFAGRVDAVIGPALGAVAFAYEAARALDVRFLFAERPAGQFSLRRGFAVRPAERLLVVEDVLTTGGSVAEVVELVRAHEAQPVAVACLIDRRPEPQPVGGLPVHAYLRLDPPPPVHPASSCPLCKLPDGEPARSPGSRHG